MGDQCQICAESEKDLNDTVAFCPEFTNPCGKVARDAIVSKLKLSTPGRHTEAFNKNGEPFVDIFFPNHQAAKYSNNVTQVVTSLSDSWWSDFSIVVLCQSMYYQTSDLRSQLLIDTINSTVYDNNNKFQSKSFDWYVYVFGQQTHGYEKSSAMCKDYLSVLNSSNWIELHKAKYSQGQWVNPEWKIFHHCVKLTSLGATVNEINSWLTTCEENGLYIPDTVGVNKWKSYLVWLNPIELNHEDIDQEAREGELVPKSVGSMVPLGEENSFEFTAIGQPGNKYRSTGGGCCFTKDTKILMHDDSLKNISEIQIDDYVKTRSGNSRILFVSKTPKKDRIIYSINGFPFRFTDTQPFINYPAEESTVKPYYVTVRPDRLQMFCPTLGWEGIAKLSKDSVLINGATLTPQTIESIETHQPDPDTSDILYDLIVTPNGEGRFEYFAGCNASLLLVASEISSMEGATDSTLEAILTFLKIVKSTLIPLRQLFRQFIPLDELLACLMLTNRVTKDQMFNYCSASKQISHLGPEDKPLEKNQLLKLILQLLPTILNPQDDLELIFGCRLFECLNFHHLRELEHFFLLQWRQKPSSKTATHFAITIFLFSIDSPTLAQAPIDKVTKLIFRLRHKHDKMLKRSMFPLEKDSNCFQTAFYQCIYLGKEWLEDLNAKFSLELTLHSDESENHLYKGIMENISLSEANNRENIQMFDYEKNPVGRVSLDWRHLTEEAVQLEKESFAIGQKTNNLELTESISEYFSSHLSSIYLSLI